MKTPIIKLILVFIILSLIFIVVINYPLSQINRNEKAVIKLLYKMLDYDHEQSNIQIYNSPNNQLHPFDFFNKEKTNKSGYLFTLVSGGETKKDSWWLWSVAAWPINYKVTGIRSFYLDNTGLIRGSDIGGSIGNIEMPPHDR